MRENTLRNTLHVCAINDTQKIQSSDWPKWHCALWCYVISRLFWSKHDFRSSDKRAVYTSILTSNEPVHKHTCSFPRDTGTDEDSNNFSHLCYSHDYKTYCKTIFINWTFNIMYFIGRAIYEFKIPIKYLFT